MYMELRFDERVTRVSGLSPRTGRAMAAMETEFKAILGALIKRLQP